MAKTQYDNSFFNYMTDAAIKSTFEAVPYIYNIFKPQSVLDVGCGTASWLMGYNKLFGVEDYRGVDGDYVDPKNLKIPAEKFVPYDLTKYYDAGRKFDLVYSLEVAEHLPDASADDFVRTLVDASKGIIVFSAALPGQGGTFHINEQFPEYWAQKFQKHGFVAVDYLRKKMWNNNVIDYWYRQNILIFIKPELLSNYPELQEAYKNTDPEFLTRIHPFLLQKKDEHIATLKSPIKHLRYRMYIMKERMKGNTTV